MLRRALLIVPLVLLLLIGGGLAWAYTAAPGFIASSAQDWVATNLRNKRLAIGKVDLDPFELKVTLDDVAIADTRAPGRPLAGAQRLVIDAALGSITAGYPRLDAVTVTAPFADAELRKDGSLNLAELVPPDDGEPVPEVWIGDLRVTDGRLAFTDGRRAAPVTRRLTPIAFDLKDFTTRSNDGGGFRFDATSDAGEELHWRGTLGMAPVASQGEFRIGALQLVHIGRMAGDLLPVTLTDGIVDIAGTYQVALPPAVPGKPVPPPAFDADITTLAVKDAALKAPTGDRVELAGLTVAPTRLRMGNDALELGEVALSGLGITRPGGERAAVTAMRLAPTRYTLSTGIAEVGALAVDGVSVTGRGRNAETVALARLAVAPSRVDSGASKADIGAITLAGLRGGARVNADYSTTVPGLWPQKLPAAGKASAGPGWAVSLAGVALTDSSLRLTVATGPKPRTLNIAPVAFRMGPVTSALDKPIDFDASARINGRARLAASGTATTAPAGTMKLSVKDLPLAEMATLGPPLPVAVKAGTLALDGTAKFGGKQPSFDGRMGVAGLDIAGPDGNRLLAWRNLDVSGIRATPARLAIARIAFDRAQSQIIVSPTRSINVMDAAGVPASEDAPETTPEAAAATPAPVLAAAAVVPQAAPAPAPATPEKPGRKIAAPISSSANALGKLIPISIGEVRFRDSVIGFRDLSVDPSFAAQIQGFSGTVTGLSTRPGTQARFNLKGYIIDRFSPVTITGNANVFAYDANTDITAKFSNIELPVFNPYSGRYAGYAIDKGKLTTTLHYRIDNRALQADHNIRIDQLKWGAATDSKEKVPLPIRMATGLLKDSNGVIDLDLPVGGTLDDPQFRIWPVIWKIVGNVFTKIITAPFKFIGSLFGGGGDDAQFIAFAPGSAMLPDDTAKRLDAIAKGLKDKEDVSLDIPAGAGLKEDAEAMSVTALHSAALAGKKGKTLAPDYAGFDAGKKLDRLKALYKAKFGKGPQFPEDGSIPKAGMLAGGAEKDAARTAQIAWLEGQLAPKFLPDDAALKALGQARADAVKQALLADGGIPPERVFIAADQGPALRDGKVAVELKVK